MLHALVPAPGAREGLPTDAAGAPVGQRAQLVPAPLPDTLQGALEGVAFLLAGGLFRIPVGPGGVHAPLVLGEEVLAVEQLFRTRPRGVVLAGAAAYIAAVEAQLDVLGGDVALPLVLGCERAGAPVPPEAAHEQPGRSPARGAPGLGSLSSRGGFGFGLGARGGAFGHPAGGGLLLTQARRGWGRYNGGGKGGGRVGGGTGFEDRLDLRILVDGMGRNSVGIEIDPGGRTAPAVSMGEHVGVFFVWRRQVSRSIGPAIVDTVRSVCTRGRRQVALKRRQGRH